MTKVFMDFWRCGHWMHFFVWIWNIYHSVVHIDFWLVDYGLVQTEVILSKLFKVEATTTTKTHWYSTLQHVWTFFRYNSLSQNFLVHVTKSCTLLKSYLSSPVIFWTSVDGWVLSVQWSDSWCSKALTHSSHQAKNTLTTWSWTWRIFPTGSDRIYKTFS